MRFYIDTSIWMDYYENRRDRFRPLGEWAFRLFKKIEKDNDVVLCSDFVVDELTDKYTEDKIKEIFDIVKEHNLIILKKNEKQIREAIRLSKKRKLPFGDAIHAILSRDNKAVLVARNHHFEELQDIAKAKKPEELI